MLRVAALIAKISFHDQDEIETLISCLKGKGHIPLIRSMLSGMFNLAQMTEPDHSLITKIISPKHPIFMR